MLRRRNALAAPRRSIAGRALPLTVLVVLAGLRAAAAVCYQTSAWVGYGNSAPLVDGVGTASRIYSPYDLEPTANSLGYYISEQNGHRVRYMNMTTRAVTCVAGSVNGTSGQVDGVGTLALFNTPEGLALDTLRNVLYVTSFSGTTLRRIDLSTRAVTTVAGNAVAASVDGVGTAASLQSVRGAAMDVANNIVYLGAWANCTIRMFNATSRLVSTLTSTGGCSAADGPTAADVHLYNPSVIRLINGSLWVADTSSGNFRIIAIRRPGVLGGSTSLMPAGQTFPSGWVRGFDVDLASGALYLCAYLSAGQVYRVDLASPTNRNAIAGNSSAAAGSVEGVGAAARFTQMLSCRFDAPTQSLLVADFSASRIRALSLANCSASATPSASATASTTLSASAAASATPSQGTSAAASLSAAATASSSSTATPAASVTAAGSPSSSATDSPSQPPLPPPPSPTSAAPGASATAAAPPAASTSATAAASAADASSSTTSATASLSFGASPSASSSVAGTTTVAPVSLQAATGDAGMSAATIGGGVGGAVAALAVAAAAATVVLRRRRQAKRLATAAPHTRAASAGAAAVPTANPLIAAAGASGSFRGDGLRPAPPRAVVLPPTRAAAAAAPSASKQPSSRAAPSDLPDGWEERFSKSRSAPYWVHRDSGTSQWEKPAS